MKIAFWSPTPFAGRKSTNLLLMALLFGKENGEQLILHADATGSGPEHYLLSGRNRRRMMSRKEFGLELLDRLLQCERYEKQMVINSSYSFARGRIHVLPAGTGGFFKDAGHADRVLDAVLYRTEQEFQTVWVEAPAGEGELAGKICQKADLVVINLAQSPAELEKLKTVPAYAHELFFFGAYEKRSVFSVHNLSLLYPRLEKKCAVIPYYRELLSAGLSGRLEEFFLKWDMAGEERESYGFFQEVLRARSLICRLREEMDVF